MKDCPVALSLAQLLEHSGGRAAPPGGTLSTSTSASGGRAAPPGGTLSTSTSALDEHTSGRSDRWAPAGRSDRWAPGQETRRRQQPLDGAVVESLGGEDGGPSPGQ